MRQKACHVWHLFVFVSVLWFQNAPVLAQFGSNTQALKDEEGIAFFESRIRPVLVANCYECHNSVDTAEGELALDWQGAMKEGGEGGNVLRSDDGASLLLKVVRHEIAGLEMPEGGKKLSDQEIADL